MKHTDKFYFRDGQVFGMWSVVSPDPRGTSIGKTVCRCSCGQVKSVINRNLALGRSTNCGCTRKTHGMAKSHEYRCYQAMKTRCYNPKSTDYHLYGGRGITVCERWRNSFENFLADMGVAPLRWLSLDRFPDKDGNYEPGNVRWATPSQQAANSNLALPITYNGETLCRAEWARRLGLSTSAFSLRIKAGDPMECLDPTFGTPKGVA